MSHADSRTDHSGVSRGPAAAATWGELACCRDDHPYVVPISFDFDGEHLYSFATLGQKIVWMRENPNVCVEVDEIDDRFHWTTVLVFGRYEELRSPAEHEPARERARSLFEQRDEWWQPAAAKAGPVGASRADRLSHRHQAGSPDDAPIGRRSERQNPYSMPSSGVTRSVSPLVPSVKRRLKSTSSRPCRLALNPTAALDAQNDSWKIAMSSNVAEPDRADGRERLDADARRVDGAAPQQVGREAELVGDADVGAERVEQLIRKVVFLAGLDVAGQHAVAVPLVAQVDVRRDAPVRP